jgi:glycosyltransferase involved in cell wall biosynthesis
MKTIIYMESSEKFGGQEMQIVTQMDELRLRNWQPILLCNYTSEVGTYAEKTNHKIKRINLRNSFDISGILETYKILKQLKPSAIVVHSGHDSSIGVIASYCYRFLNHENLKIIRIRTYQPGKPKAFHYNHLYDVTFTPSFFLRESLLKNKKINSIKISEMYPGINFQKIDEDANLKLPRFIDNWINDNPGPLIVHGAMLRGEKGHSFFLDILQKIKIKWPNIRYIISGSGEEHDLIYSKIRILGLEDNVLLAGMVNPIAPLIKKATIAVLPSIKEPLGMFQIESQYLQIPTIANEVDGIPETIEKNVTGLLVKPYQESWVEAISWALENKQKLQQLADNGRNFVINKFCIKKNIETLISAIES